MKYFFIIALLALAFFANGQKNIRFSSRNYAGLLEGESKSALQLQTINGIKYKTWFAGAGTGLDWYYQRSIPLFASVSKDVFKKDNRNFYLSANAGVNFPWKRDNMNEWYYGDNGKYRAGLYWYSGLGYKIGVGKNNDAVLLHLGYSYKHISERIKTILPCFNPPCPETTERYDFHLKRLSLMLGWNF
jgi:hypothetical protein